MEKKKKHRPTGLTDHPESKQTHKNAERAAGKKKKKGGQRDSIGKVSWSLRVWSIACQLWHHHQYPSLSALTQHNQRRTKEVQKPLNILCQKHLLFNTNMLILKLIFYILYKFTAQIPYLDRLLWCFVFLLWSNTHADSGERDSSRFQEVEWL